MPDESYQRRSNGNNNDQNVNARTFSEGMKVMFDRLSKFETERGRLKGLAMRPRDNDIVITTSPKCGTTWMQQICHQLRAADAGGDLDFEEISAVVPFLEMAHDQHQNLDDPQYGEVDADKPRLFKTHAWYDHCPKFRKTIVVVRNPCDVVVSFYRFFEGWFFDEGSVSLEEFGSFWVERGVPETRMQNASYFVHLASWYERRRDPNVMFVFYEDLKDDLEHQVRRVARFISNERHDFTKEEYVRLATERSTFEYMHEHAFHFDEKLSTRYRNEAMGLPKDTKLRSSKLRGGSVGTGRAELPAVIRAKILAKWGEVVAPVTGCATYEDLRQQFRADAVRQEREQQQEHLS